MPPFGAYSCRGGVGIDLAEDPVDHPGRDAQAQQQSWSPFGRSGIAARQLVAIVLFSSLVTLLSTILQLYLDYRRDVGAIENRLGEIERSYLRSLSGSLWNLDANQIQVQLDGILRLPDMQALEVRETVPEVAHPLVVTAGNRHERAVVRRDYPMVYDDRGTIRTIGVLYAEATLAEVYGRLLDKTVVILVSQGIKTFLVSMFILFIIHRLVTRHLTAIAGSLDNHDRHATPLELVLERPKPACRDELDRMVDAINSMSGDLYAAFTELAGANAELEKDIAIRQAKEQEMQELIQELVNSNTSLSRFVYIASHDLQEPLRSITSFVQLLARKYADKLDDEAAEYISFVVKSSVRMHDLINDLLVFSRIDAKEAKFSPISSQSACEAAIENLHESISESGAAISVGTLPEVVADATQLMEVFQNLIGNAIKFHGSGMAPSVSVTASSEEGAWRFAVADNGIGIQANQQDIFEIFRRLHTVGEFPGTGVGLAICKAIVSRHNGTIWFDSTPGQGTTFYFTIPKTSEN